MNKLIIPCQEVNTVAYSFKARVKSKAMKREDMGEKHLLAEEQEKMETEELHIHRPSFTPFFLLFAAIYCSPLPPG